MGEKVRPLQFFEPHEVNFFASLDSKKIQLVENVKKSQQRLIDNGLCSRCGKNDLSSKLYCDFCLNIRKEYDRRKRNNRKKYSICVICGNEPIANNSKAVCKLCLSRSRERYRERQRLNKTRAQ
jgi:hypothetical protein